MIHFFDTVRELALEGFGRQKANHQIQACVDFPNGIGWIDITDGMMGLVTWRVFKGHNPNSMHFKGGDQPCEGWLLKILEHMQSGEGMEWLFGAPYSFFYDEEPVTEEEGERRSAEDSGDVVIRHGVANNDESQCLCGCSGEYPCGKPNCIHCDN